MILANKAKPMKTVDNRELGGGLLLVSSASEQSTERGSFSARAKSLGRSIFLAAAVLLAAGLSTIPAFGQTSIPFSFTYDFGSGTGQASVPSITFSDFRLNNVSKFGTALGVPIVGPWGSDPVADDQYVAFSVFAPSGYEVSVDRRSLYTYLIQAGASFRVSAPGTSQEIQEFVFTRFPGDVELLFKAGGRGELTVVPEPSTVLGGIVAAGLVAVFFVRRLARSRSLAAGV